MNEKDITLLYENYLKSIPSLKNVKVIDFENIHEIEVDNYTCVCRELTWKEASFIDYESFTTVKNDSYFNSEKEKRMIVEKSLLKIIDPNNEDIGVDNISFDFIEKYWSKYQKYLHLNFDEVSAIYNSAKKYFDPDFDGSFPVHPLIIETDYITKGIVNYSKKEFENITIREFEAIQLILATKNEIKSSHD